MNISSFEEIYGIKETALRKNLVQINSLESFENNHRLLLARMSELLEVNRNPNALVYFGLLNRTIMPYSTFSLNQIESILPYRECGIEFVATVSLVGENLNFSADMGETSQDVGDLLETRSTLINAPQTRDVQMKMASLPVIKDYDRWLLERIQYSLRSQEA
ncbi:MAG: hypothetical protein Q8Q31_04345 [Nanoarchaeota archaeon]|nr:hypothetical protein [Nanoarchaeota archaeon]